MMQLYKRDKQLVCDRMPGVFNLAKCITRGAAGALLILLEKYSDWGKEITCQILACIKLLVDG